MLLMQSGIFILKAVDKNIDNYHSAVMIAQLCQGFLFLRLMLAQKFAFLYMYDTVILYRF